MATIRFEPAGVQVAGARPGDRIVDLTDRQPEAGVPYACRAATCGTCRVEVLRGAEALSAIGDDEADVLEIFDDAPRVRLACQLRLERETDRVVLRVVSPF